MKALQDYSLAPFPVIGEEVRARYGIGGLWLRPFGALRSDLDVMLSLPNRPHLVTSILSACSVTDSGSKPPDDLIWDLTVGTRIEALVRISALSAENGGSLLTCTCRACGEAMRVEIDLDEITASQDGSGPSSVSLSIGQRRLTFRVPTGQDQDRWFRAVYDDGLSAVRAIIMSLATEGDGPFMDERLITDEVIDRLGVLLDEHDPLVNYHIVLKCPACASDGLHEIDLEGHAIDRLRSVQAALFDVIHQLASRYHWSEEEILSLPPWRRSRYLSLVRKEEQ